MRDPIIHDLDILRPRTVIVKLAGLEIDISQIPSGVALEITSDYEMLKELAGGLSGQPDAEKSLDIFDKTLHLALRTAKKPFGFHNLGGWWKTRKLSKRWLVKNTNILQLRRFIDLVIELLFKSFESNREDADDPPRPLQAVSGT